MGGWDPGDYVIHLFSEGIYLEKGSTLYLTKEKPKDLSELPKTHPNLNIKEIKKVEKRFLPWRFVFLEVKEGIRARQTLLGGLELKVNPGEGKSFELFNLLKKEYKTLKNYTALQE